MGLRYSISSWFNFGKLYFSKKDFLKGLNESKKHQIHVGDYLWKDRGELRSGWLLQVSTVCDLSGWVADIQV